MKRKNAYIWCLIIALFSFLGFFTENVWLCIRYGLADNRNMLFPFLLGYGLAIFGIYAVFGTPTEPRIGKFRMDTHHAVLNLLIFFALVFVCVSLGEMGFGILVEKTCGIKWWNYSSLPLSITQYTSVPTSAGFTVLVMLFLQCLIQPLFRLFGKINRTVLAVTAWTLMSLMVLDFLHSAVYMLVNHRTFQLWAIKMADIAAMLS